jgi:hypothetical protein
MIDEQVFQLIGTFGFPIVMCLLLWYDKRTSQKDMTTALNNNTLAISEITTLIKEKLK